MAWSRTQVRSRAMRRLDASHLVRFDTKDVAGESVSLRACILLILTRQQVVFWRFDASHLDPLGAPRLSETKFKIISFEI